MNRCTCIHLCRFFSDAQVSIDRLGFATAAAVSGRMTCDMLIAAADSLLPALFDHMAAMEAWLALDREGVDTGSMLKIMYESAGGCLREMLSSRAAFCSVFENGKHYAVACDIDFDQVRARPISRFFSLSLTDEMHPFTEAPRRHSRLSHRFDSIHTRLHLSDSARLHISTYAHVSDSARLHVSRVRLRKWTL